MPDHFWWDELSDGELLERLFRRGVELGDAYRLTDARDGSWAARQRIAEVLST